MASRLRPVVAAALGLWAALSACSGGTGAPAEDSSFQAPETTEPISAAPSTAPLSTASPTSTARPAATTSSPSSNTSPPAPEEPEGIQWSDLEKLELEVDGEVVRLERGRATLSYGGASASQFTLQNRVAQGDLDGDGDDDVVAHVVERSGGTGVFHLIVPVIDDDGEVVVRPAVSVGDRIVMDSISVSEGVIEVVFFDRYDDEPYIVITRRTTLEIDLSPSVPLVRVIEVAPLEDLPLPGSERPEIDLRFESGEIGAARTGSINFRERQTYVVEALAGQKLEATLDAPLGLWLDVRLRETVLTSAAERSQSVQAVLPLDGPWEVTVFSSHAGSADYDIYLEVRHIEVRPGDGIGSGPGDAPVGAHPERPSEPAADGDVVYLTFDDGPHRIYTPQVLDVLARHDARATFFVLGSLAEEHPHLIERIVAEGHTVANHTWNHEALGGLPREAFDETVSRTQQVLAEASSPCLRPPYGSIDAFTEQWAGSHGLALMTWTVDPADWRQPPAESIADHIVDHATAESVVLLHDGGGHRTETVRGLDMALERLSARGVRFEPVCR